MNQTTAERKSLDFLAFFCLQTHVTNKFGKIEITFVDTEVQTFMEYLCNVYSASKI